SALMGRLPAITAKGLNQQPISLPQGLPAGRTLALVAFERGHRAEIESWITGLQLRENNAIAWLKMPVLDDPGSESARTDIERGIRARHSAEVDRARLVPVFTNRDAFMRAAGLSGSSHAWVLVVGRDGQVLARVEGEYSPEKGQALRETLLQSF
ncbi:MAG: hypothetical protein M3150_01735, partial [Pseudomonadota bacterium]|nr:hypothetical protein [Pseudomonadota bacterium]